jgi:monofunctional biosynthetic peptidoglycan transglycosylase
VAGRRSSRLVFAWKLFCYGLGTLAAFVIGLQLWFFAQVLYWKYDEPPTSAFMDQRLAALREKNPKAWLRHRFVPYERISPHLKRAVVTAEDARFLDHEGFDWEAIAQAHTKNERRGRIVAGASTISQQLAKNLFLSSSRSWLRKGQEALITWMIEAALSKRRILELYLNYAEWGEGVFGAEAAAQHHFGVPASVLSAEQSAYLAAILPSPRRYARGRTTPYVDGRASTILIRASSAQIP